MVQAVNDNAHNRITLGSYLRLAVGALEKGSDTYATLKAAELCELLKLEFLDCIHPDLYESKAAIGTFRTHLKELIPSFWRGVCRRVHF